MTASARAMRPDQTSWAESASGGTTRTVGLASSSAMCRTSTSPRSPFCNWIIHAGQEVARLGAAVPNCRPLRSKIF